MFFEISRPTKLRFIIILMNLKNILIFKNTILNLPKIQKNTFGLFEFSKSLMFVYIKLRLPILITNVLHHDTK